jgi:FkbM family methyltransferase
MYLKIKNFIEDCTGLTFYRKSTPWGMDLQNDIERLIPGWSPKIIFDVGANIGQTAKSFHKAWPDARILSFEPVKTTFESLEAALINIPNTEAFPLALGSTFGEASIKLFSNSKLASLDSRFSSESNNHYEKIQISTVERFCLEHSIKQVNLLKIDTEGYDLEVLKGSENLLKTGNVDFVFAEISIRSAPGKVLLTDPDTFLKDFGMIYVGLYSQEFIQEHHIHFANALFVKESLLF